MQVNFAAPYLNSIMSPMKFPGWMRPGRKSGASHIPRRLVVLRSCMIVALVWLTYYSVVSNPGGRRFSRTIIEDDQEVKRFPSASDAVKDLIAAIKETTRLAAGGTEPPELSDFELATWEFANPCRSRLGLKGMYTSRKYATDVEDNVAWGMVLQEYIKLHRTCIHRVGNLREYFLARNSSIPGCKFAIADYSEGGGLGNKILVVSNIVLYSILTQRVVLVPTATLVPTLMCEPFPGSSWKLDATDSFPVRPWNPAHIGSWTYHDKVYIELDNAKISIDKESMAASADIYSSAMGIYQYQPDSRFWCNTEQAAFSSITWLYFTGCLYTIPRLFAVPQFRPVLEALFPDRLVLTHLVRTTMLPEDSAWDRIVGSFKANLETADRRVGVQVRYRRNLEEYQQMNDVINDRIMKCAIDNGVLPYPVESNATNDELADGERPVVKIFVASLFTGFAEMLSEKYVPKPTSTGHVLGVVQLSHETMQTYGLEVDRQSLVEIMMLSFSDDLFVTPLSTFGGLAHAYGVLVPWIIDYRDGYRFRPCERGQSVDLCYQEAHFTYSCPHDLDVNGRLISDVVPYLRNCLAVDSQLFVGPGLQLLTSHPQ